MKFNKIRDSKAKRPNEKKPRSAAKNVTAKPAKPVSSKANSDATGPSNKAIKKKRFFKQKQKKADEVKIKTKVCIPQTEEEISANWMQMAELIKKENASNEKKASGRPTKDTNNKKANDDRKQLSRQEKFKLKRKLKREHAKLKRKKIGSDQPDGQAKRRPDAKHKAPKAGKEQSNQANDLWFEVDQIYLDKAVNPGQPAQPLKDDDLVKKHSSTGVTKAIGIDCEMVGVGPRKQSALARISMVNQFGHTIYDKFVLPDEPITDYRTFVSGIRPGDLKDGLPIEIARREVEEIVQGKILVGHAIRNDLSALGIRHPPAFVRDTSVYFKQMFNGKVPSLKRLSETLLNVKVQTGEHSSVEDAKATMRLYTLYKKDWEASLSKSNKKRPAAT